MPPVPQRLITVGEIVGRDAATQAHGRLDGLAEAIAFRLGLHGDVDVGGRPFGTDGLQHLLRHDFGRPPGRDCVLLDFGELAVTNGTDCRDTFALNGLKGGRPRKQTKRKTSAASRRKPA